MDVVLSPLAATDKDELLRLGEQVNEQYVVPQLSSEGQWSMRYARKKDMLQVFDLDIYRALKATLGEDMIGYIAWKNGNYISQLYVKSEYQGYGVGRRLVEGMIACSGAEVIVLKASVNAIGFYQRLGFIVTSEEKSCRGIRYVPMALKGIAI